MDYNKKNKGFTLIELIVVVAVLAILTSTLALSSTIIQTGKAKKFANTYSALLSQCKINTLCGAQAAYLELNFDGTTYTAVLHENGSVVKTQELGNASISCTYTCEGGSAQSLTSLCIGYDRTTGAFLNLEDVKDSSGTAVNGALAGRLTEVDAVCVGTYAIHMVPETGYTSIERK